MIADFTDGSKQDGDKVKIGALVILMREYFRNEFKNLEAFLKKQKEAKK